MADAPPPTQTVNQYTQTRLPAWIQPYYENLAQGAQTEAARGYQQYQDPRIAGFTAPEQAAMQGINQLGTSGGPWQMNQANQAMNQAYGMAQNAPGQGYGDLSGVAGLYGNQIGGASNVANQYAGQLGQQGAAAQGVAGDYAGQFGAQGLAANQQANQYAGQFGQAAQNFAGLGQQAGQPMMFADADMSQYTKPYQTHVQDIATREALKVGEIQRQQLGSRAAQAGAFGGYRHGLQEQGIDRGVREQVSDMKTKGLQDAFNRGIGLFQADRAAQQQGLGQQMQAMQGGLGALGAGLGAQQFGQQFGQASTQQGLGAQQFGQQFGQGATQAGLGAQQFGQQFGQAGAGGMGQALGQANQLYNQGIGQLGQVAQGYGQMGQQQEAMAFDRLGRMQQAGQQQRALQQAGMDVNYQDFQNAQAHPQRNMSWMGSILGGFPAQQDTNQQRSMYEQQPGLFQSALSTGVSGLGLYKGLQ